MSESNTEASSVIGTIMCDYNNPDACCVVLVHFPSAPIKETTPDCYYPGTCVFLAGNGDAVEEEGTAKSLPPAGRRELLRDGNWTP